jgi:hypothetical protein
MPGRMPRLLQTATLTMLTATKRTRNSDVIYEESQYDHGIKSCSDGGSASRRVLRP